MTTSLLEKLFTKGHSPILQDQGHRLTPEDHNSPTCSSHPVLATAQLSLQDRDGFLLALTAGRDSAGACTGSVPVTRDGWVLGLVHSVCRPGRNCFSHVVGYAASSPLGALEVDTLLNTASYGPAGIGISWCQPVGPAPPSGRVRLCKPD